MRENQQHVNITDATNTYMTLVMKSSKNQTRKVLQIFSLKTNIYN